ncbi:hypothetical protein DFH09DRAFT_1293118 [Mycena vulgaris]|nr:hypothetical protein DFH09DRAFT_1293118 [Mycena vulgaris]
MGGREAVISVLVLKPVWYNSMGFSGPNFTFILRKCGYITPRFCSLHSQLDMRHALSGGVSLRALDPDPPPFLSDPPAPLSAASSPTAITDAVHETRVLVACARPLEHGERLQMSSTPPRTPRARCRSRIPRIVLRVPPHLPALLPPFMPSGPWRASSPPSITGVVHFTPSASARCRAAHILHAYAWLIHGAPDVYGRDGRPPCTGLESIAIARVATASDAARISAWRGRTTRCRTFRASRDALWSTSGVAHLSPQSRGHRRQERNRKGKSAPQSGGVIYQRDQPSASVPVIAVHDDQRSTTSKGPRRRRPR